MQHVFEITRQSTIITIKYLVTKKVNFKKQRDISEEFTTTKIFNASEDINMSNKIESNRETDVSNFIKKAEKNNDKVYE